MTTAGRWFVYDPAPIGPEWPALVGPFANEDEAHEYANESHPDDGEGNTVVLRASLPPAKAD